MSLLRLSHLAAPLFATSALLSPVLSPAISHWGNTGETKAGEARHALRRSRWPRGGRGINQHPLTRSGCRGSEDEKDRYKPSRPRRLFLLEASKHTPKARRVSTSSTASGVTSASLQNSRQESSRRHAGDSISHSSSRENKISCLTVAGRHYGNAFDASASKKQNEQSNKPIATKALCL
jgi:hypothetical protein